MNFQTVVNLIGASLQNIAIFDTTLLDRKVREECVNHRLAYYIESIYEEIVKDDLFYSVDLEYNKNLGNNDKKIPGLDGKIISIRPDIIVHKRPDNQNNLIAIEAKHGANNKHDIHKLRMLLEIPYSYSYAVGINYFPNKDYFGGRIFWKNDELFDENFRVPKISRDQIEFSFVNKLLYIPDMLQDA